MVPPRQLRAPQQTLGPAESRSLISCLVRLAFRPTDQARGLKVQYPSLLPPGVADIAFEGGEWGSGSPRSSSALWPSWGPVSLDRSRANSPGPQEAIVPSSECQPYPHDAQADEPSQCAGGPAAATARHNAPQELLLWGAPLGSQVPCGANRHLIPKVEIEHL